MRLKLLLILLFFVFSIGIWKTLTNISVNRITEKDKKLLLMHMIDDISDMIEIIKKDEISNLSVQQLEYLSDKRMKYRDTLTNHNSGQDLELQKMILEFFDLEDKLVDSLITYKSLIKKEIEAGKSWGKEMVLSEKDSRSEFTGKVIDYGRYRDSFHSDEFETFVKVLEDLFLIEDHISDIIMNLIALEKKIYSLAGNSYSNLSEYEKCKKNIDRDIYSNKYIKQKEQAYLLIRMEEERIESEEAEIKDLRSKITNDPLLDPFYLTLIRNYQNTISDRKKCIKRIEQLFPNEIKR